MLTQEIVRELFAYDQETGHLIWKSAMNQSQTNIGNIAGKIANRGYRVIKIQGEPYQAHRLVFLWHFGFLPNIVDHIDRDRTNNRIENLRQANTAQNSSNAKKRAKASSKWKGVSYQTSKNWWRAYISFENKARYLGRFLSAEEAALVYNFHAKELHGEYAVYNDADQTCPLVNAA